MANEYVSLLDVAKMKNNDAAVPLIDETTKATPEITNASFRTISGRTYKTLVLLNKPTATFRGVNEGSEATKPIWTEREFQTYISTPRWAIDTAIADNAGPDDTPETLMTKVAMEQVRAQMVLFGNQFFYGVADQTSKGFAGLISSYDSTNMVVDAGGTTATTGASVWLVRFGIDSVQWIVGNDGEMKVNDVYIGDEFDASGKPYRAYKQDMTTYIGVQVASQNAVCRIKKLTEDSGKGLTDALIYKALAKFKVGMGPTAIFMNMRSLEQLRSSRTATNATGTEAPYPTAINNIPILVTESLSNTEALTL